MSEVFVTPTEVANDAVEALLRAEREGRAIEPLSVTRSLKLQEAYEIQQSIIDRKLASDPRERWLGLKAGLTSRAKQKMVNIDEPILGQLLASNVIVGDELHLDGLIQPRVEPEVAFHFAREVVGYETSEEEISSAIDHAFPALEILDSRFEQYKFRIEDVVADNASTSRVLLSEMTFPAERGGLSRMQVSVSINGEVREAGTTDAVLGHPLASALWVTQKWARLGKTIPAGSILLTGGITTAIPVSPGDEVVGRFEGWGELHLRCV
ncbi:MAG TPA: fumarylacetoacetate hydrolase family protein [Pyrinomonadaceae bacterium]|nr:fumarylacetoacetate hydrolase family protein [Pyrinomonadaceae bacterium]